MALTGDAASTSATLGKIEKEKSLVAPILVELADLNERSLDFIKGLRGNRTPYSLVNKSLQMAPEVTGRTRHQPGRGNHPELLLPRNS